MGIGVPISVIFVGSGALLTRAIVHCLSTETSIRLVACPCGDSAIKSLKRCGVVYLETNNPSVDLLTYASEPNTIIFSINNRFIFNDTFLSCGAKFFNVHNGLVQDYRGLGEVCVFFAVYSGAARYGVTLHEILPFQSVDSGPVVDQLMFPIDSRNSFAEIMRRSFELCDKIFNLNFEKIIKNEYSLKTVDQLGDIYDYRNLKTKWYDLSLVSVPKARDLGAFESYFPKLRTFIDSI